jgi:hypothetical protein
MRSTKKILTISLKTRDRFWSKSLKIYLIRTILMMKIKSFLKIRMTFECRFLGILTLKRTPFQIEKEMKKTGKARKMTMIITCKKS